jgi:AmmeMemoRadiSam system protein B
MRRKQSILIPFSIILAFGIVYILTRNQERMRRLYQVHSIQEGTDTIRGLTDTVGFSTTADMIEAVVSKSEELESLSEFRKGKQPWIAGISPHDDHLYAGRVYVHLFRNIKAKRIVLFGVAHKAWRWEVEDLLIFDGFHSWKGPYGPVNISTLRETVMHRLSEDDYLISDEYHSEEHSLEGLIPFLQYYNRDAEIVPILVPYMEWERMDSLAESLSQVLSRIIKKNRWVLGEDIAFVISNDCVHYGDEDWGGKNYADFGVGEAGYQEALEREMELIHDHLIGPIQPVKLRKLLYLLVNDEDVYQYQIPWCGRFSVPFGLTFLFHLTKDLKRDPLEGHYLRYGTSVDPGKLDLPDIGLGLTAPANLRHWVGYVAVGYL